MSVYTMENLYRAVSDARESCAGSDVQDIPYALAKVQYAIDFAYNAHARESTINKLIEVKRILTEAQIYADRLPADQILSDILNTDLERYG